MWTIQSDWSHELDNLVRRTHLYLTIKRLLIYWISVLSGALLKITESYLELSSDHFPVIFTINNKIMIKGKSCTLSNAKIKWPYFQELLKTTLDNSILLKTDNIIRAVESFNYAVQQAAWSATPTSSNQYRIFICNKRRTSKKRKLHKWW